MRRRGALLMLAAAFAAPALRAGAAGPALTVAKSPTCGCCNAWVDHMRDAGFEVTVQDVPQNQLQALKARLGITHQTASCHTATIDGYVVEGHVPASDVRRLLDERPQALGLAVPGMPVGSPGMEMGTERDPYDTLLLGQGGDTTVFTAHR